MQDDMWLYGRDMSLKKQFEIQKGCLLFIVLDVL